MDKPKIGDKFYLVKTYRRRGMLDDKYSAVVSKVGIKYFTVEVYQGPTERRPIFEAQFAIETRTQKTQYSVDLYLFDSKQVYDDQREEGRWRQKLNKTFDHWNREKYTLDQYRAAAKILGITLEGDDNA